MEGSEQYKIQQSCEDRNVTFWETLNRFIFSLDQNQRKVGTSQMKTMAAIHNLCTTSAEKIKGGEKTVETTKNKTDERGSVCWCQEE